MRKKEKTKGQTKREKYAKFKKPLLCLAFFIAIALFSTPGHAWEDINYSYCNDVAISTATNGTWFYEMESSKYNYSDFATGGIDIRVYNGTCSNSGQSQLNFYRETWNTSGNSYLLINLSATATTNVSIYYGNPTAIDVSNYTKVIYNDGDVTFATTTGWTTVGAGVSIDTANKYIAVNSANANANGVYASLKSGYPANFSILYTANMTSTSQGGGPGVTSDVSKACYNAGQTDVCGIQYNGNAYYLEGNIGGTNIETNAVYNANGILHYGRITKAGNVYNLTVYSNKNMTTASASAQKTQAGFTSVSYFWGFDTFATGYGSNTIAGWINRTYMIDWSASPPSFSTASRQSAPIQITVTVLLPTNTTYELDPYGNRTVNASVNVTGNSTIYSCNFTLNGTQQYAPEVANNTAVNFSMANVTPGQHNFTAFCNTTSGNATKSVYFRVYYNASLLLNSTNGWAIYGGQSTTLSCSGYPAVRLKVNGVYVSNPYAITPTMGIWPVECEASDTFNYTETSVSNNLAVNNYVTCFNESTYGYELNYTPATGQTAFNFTSLVDAHFVKADLSDVWAVGLNSSNISINTTNGYFLVVNTTNPIRLRFTNYFSNNVYAEGNTSVTVVNVTNYSQVSPVAIISLLDEMNETSLYPENTTVVSILECSRGENFVILGVNETDFAFSGLDYFSRALVEIKYSSTVYYSRQRYLSDSWVQHIDFYVADAYTMALDRIDFKMLDSSKYDSLLTVYKTSANGTKIIDEGYFDASRYHSVYLIEDMTYYLKTINSGGTETEFGIMVITAPGEKELSKTTIDLNPEALLISDYITMNAYKYNNTVTGDTELIIQYADTSNQTQQVNITAKFQNGTTLSFYSYNSTNNALITINVSTWANQSFEVDYKITHGIFGNSPVQYMISVLQPATVNLGLSSLFMELISMFFILSVGAMTTRETIVPGVLITMVVLMLFYGIGWLSISMTAIAFILFLLMLALLYYFKVRG